MEAHPEHPLSCLEWAPIGRFWWIPVDLRSWATLFGDDLVHASSAAAFEFMPEDEPRFMDGRVKGLEDWLEECIRDRVMSVAAITLGKHHMSYLLSQPSSTTVDFVQLDTWGDCELPIATEFSRCVRAMCSRLSSSTKFIASIDYWRPSSKGFLLGSFYPGAALCVTLPRLLLELVVRERVPLFELADYCTRLDKSRIDAFLTHLAEFNLLLDLLISIFEGRSLIENTQEHWLYGPTRQRLDRLYSTLARYAGLLPFPAVTEF